MPFPVFVAVAFTIAAGTMAATGRLSNRGSPAIWAALIGATALVLFHGLAQLNFVVDDAFINFRYSQHLADGLGPNWNSTGRVEGYTNFLWMALLAGIDKIGFDIIISARVLGGIAVASTLFVTSKIWALWRDDDGDSGAASPYVLAAAVLGLGLSGGVAFFAFSGLETPLFMALITGGAYCYMVERRRGGMPWSAVVLAAAAMTRPDGLIAAAVTGGFKLAALRGQDRRRALDQAVAWSVVFLLLYGSYFLWRYTYYDHLLPNTFYAKVAARSAVFDRGLIYLQNEGLSTQLLPLLVGTVFLAVARPRLRHDAMYVIGLCGLMLAAVVPEGGDFMGHARFLVPTLPLLYLSGLAGLAVLLKRAIPERGHLSLIAGFGLALAALALLHDSYDPTLRQERGSYQERRALAAWLEQYTPPDYTIAAYAVGSLGYYSHRNILDLLGINDVVIAHTNMADLGHGVSGHEKYNLDYVFNDVKPEIIIATEGENRPLTRDELMSLANQSSFVRVKQALPGDQRLWDQYEPRWLFTRDGHVINFFQRNDTLGELHGPGLFGGQEQNLLATSGADAATGWTAWRSTLQPSNDGIEVRSAEIAYGPYGRTSSSSVVQQGQSYVAIVWVRSDRTIAANDYVSISLRENGKHSPQTETNGYFFLTPQWQPIWVERTLTGDNTKSLSVHLIKFSGVAKEDSFFFRDGQLNQISE